MKGEDVPKLHQVLAVMSGRKSQAEKVKTWVYHTFQAGASFIGMTRRYHPKDEEGEVFPPESKRVQNRVHELLNEAYAAWKEVIDSIATVDEGNTEARADIVIDGRVIVESVPATTLLYLEKQLKDMATLFEAIPVLDPSFDWVWTKEAECYRTPESETTKTQKVLKPLVKYEATPQHPAQVETFTVDEVIGHWKRIDYCGAIPLEHRNALVERARKLRDAVVMAREEANSIEAPKVEIAEAIFDYLGDVGNTAASV